MGSGCAKGDRVIPWMENWLYEFGGLGCWCDDCKRRGYQGIIWHKDESPLRGGNRPGSSTDPSPEPGFVNASVAGYLNANTTDLSTNGNRGGNGRSSSAKGSKSSTDPTDNKRSSDGLSSGGSNQQSIAIHRAAVSYYTPNGFSFDKVDYDDY